MDGLFASIHIRVRPHGIRTSLLIQKVQIPFYRRYRPVTGFLDRRRIAVDTGQCRAERMKLFAVRFYDNGNSGLHGDRLFDYTDRADRWKQPFGTVRWLKYDAGCPHGQRKQIAVHSDRFTDLNL